MHRIGCLDSQEALTDFGDVARYFPQGGGLLVAKKIVENRVSSENLLELLELMASISMARFKSPDIPKRYRFPFDARELEAELEQIYPIELFEDLYDPPFGNRHEYVIREFNPDAGYFVRKWAEGADFHELAREVCHQKFATGDMMNVIYRSATLLQSLVQAGVEGFSKEARLLWGELLRAPLTPQLSGEKS